MTLQAPIGSISCEPTKGNQNQTLEKETKCQNHNNPFYYYIQTSFSFSFDYYRNLVFYSPLCLIKTIHI